MTSPIHGIIMGRFYNVPWLSLSQACPVLKLSKFQHCRNKKKTLKSSVHALVLVVGDNLNDCIYIYIAIIVSE